MKSKGTAYLLWLPTLVLVAGLHRFYLGKVGTGLIWLFTWGLFGFGSLYDLFTLGNQVDIYNAIHRNAYGGGNANTNQNQNNNNIVVNLTAPAYPPPSAPAPAPETNNAAPNSNK
jgi:TM2 domain-containing membrane protein YozV